MSWLNDELPADWPTKDNDNVASNQSNNNMDFSTSQSGDSVEIEPTVAIQAKSIESTPPWKRAINPPRPNDSDSPRLTRLFIPPEIPQPQDQNQNKADQAGDEHTDQNANQNTDQKADQNDKNGSQNVSQNGNQSDGQNGGPSDFSTQSSSRSSDDTDEPEQPINRRLKVFGRPDTYTNERLGNLLSSMGGNGASLGGNSTSFGGDGTSMARNGTNTTRNGTSRGKSFNTSINESDMNLADDLQNEGRKVLQGLAPFRPHPIQESSLDELEQQLTSQDTDKHSRSWHPHATDDTTSSAVFNDQPSTSSSSSHTLDTLPPKLRNWDSIKRNLGESPAPNRVANKDSSQTLLGSGKSNRMPYAEPSRYVDPQQRHYEDISELGIHEPIRNEPVAHVPVTHQGAFRDRASHEPASREPFYHAPIHQESDSSVRRMPSGSARSATSVPASTSDSGRFGRSVSSHSVPASLDSLNGDRTPESVVKKYLQFPRPARNTQTRFADLPNRVFSGASTGTTGTAATLGNDYEEDKQDYDFSIANRDISFSAGYELLAQHIRERMPEDVADMEDLDSLDLNNCELETVLGLDKFTPHLTTLFLNDNSIRSLQGLPFNLVHLDLSSNCLSNMNRFPSCLVSTLILANNELQTLEPLATLRALSSLDVSGNNLTSLKGIESLTALRTLNIRNNHLRSIDLNLGMLVELDAAHNNLISVRLNTPNLESLDLEGNNVATLNDPLPNLRELNMQYNNSTIDFAGFQSLKVVLFDGNMAVRNFDSVAAILETFSWEQPRGDPNRKLDMSLLMSARDIKVGGGLSKGWPFPASANGVYATQHLDLCSLGIRELPANFARMFPFLKSLNLAFNKLDGRSLDVLQQCPSLERLSLFGNRLTISGEKVALKLPHIRVLDTRSQLTQRSFVRTREMPTDKYMVIVETALNSQATIAQTSCVHLQWLDGKWTNNATNTTVTTRPGFPSALYPSVWNPPGDDLADTTSYSRMETTMADEDLRLLPIDIVEAMYVHHWLQQFRIPA